MAMRGSGSMADSAGMHHNQWPAEITTNQPTALLSLHSPKLLPSSIRDESAIHHGLSCSKPERSLSSSKLYPDTREPDGPSAPKVPPAAIPALTHSGTSGRDLSSSAVLHVIESLPSVLATASDRPAVSPNSVSSPGFYSSFHPASRASQETSPTLDDPCRHHAVLRPQPSLACFPLLGRREITTHCRCVFPTAPVAFPRWRSPPPDGLLALQASPQPMPGTEAIMCAVPETRIVLQLWHQAALERRCHTARHMSGKRRGVVAVWGNRETGERKQDEGGAGLP